jgi:hypothetical protein
MTQTPATAASLLRELFAATPLSIFLNAVASMNGVPAVRGSFQTPKSA